MQYEKSQVATASCQPVSACKTSWTDQSVVAAFQLHCCGCTESSRTGIDQWTESSVALTSVRLTMIIIASAGGHARHMLQTCAPHPTLACSAKHTRAGRAALQTAVQMVRHAQQFIECKWAPFGPRNSPLLACLEHCKCSSFGPRYAPLWACIEHRTSLIALLLNAQAGPLEYAT